jgi:hypothetical protein
MTSERKRAANRRNAARSTGPRDTTRSRLNARIHGILARETVILAGEGHEDPAEFAALSDELRTEFAPASTLEGLLVDQLIAILWRWRRVLRFENAAIRLQADTTSDDWEEAQVRQRAAYARFMPQEEVWKPTEELEAELGRIRQALEVVEQPDPELSDPRVCRYFLAFCEAVLDVSIEQILGWDASWQTFDEFEPAEVAQVLDAVCTSIAVTSEEFWRRFREAGHVSYERIAAQLEQRHLVLDRQRLLVSLPDDQHLAKIQRYEAHLSRQFYKALHELQRLQIARSGHQPALPITVDFNHAGDSSESPLSRPS